MQKQKHWTDSLTTPCSKNKSWENITSMFEIISERFPTVTL
jgi:hypothetical protein